MRKLFAWLSGRRWFVSLPLVIVAGVVAYLLIAGVLNWANSTGFCGTTCHVMKPEYTAYQGSFHARVGCSECHVGPGLWAEVRAKWQGIRELWLYVTNTFERPIPSPVESLRPAREVCEHCHWPEIFYEDRALEIAHFSEDEENTRTNTYMLVKIGGGTHRAGQGRGIHWHIENPIEYIATDPQRQDIPWVRAQLDGEMVTFVDVTSAFSEADLLKYEVRVMDCIDCHNRATHVFRSATVAVEEAMADGLLPADLPYFRQKAVEVMGASYASQGEALDTIASLLDYYRQEYPQVYQQRAREIQGAVMILQGFYQSSHFPEYEVYPGTYPDNIGHSESPGCFRCHDGKHLSNDGRSVRLHCNICHTIPETVAAGEPLPEIPFQMGWQPENHLDSSWMADHRFIIDQTCASCHDMQTYCANPSCHGRSWPYVDLAVIEPPFPLPSPGQPQPTIVPTPAGEVEPTPGEPPSFSADIQPMLEAQCAATCHNATAALGQFIAEDYAGVQAAVVPGDPEASKLVQVQRGQHPARLSAQELDQVIAWIRAGAPDN